MRKKPQKRTKHHRKRVTLHSTELSFEQLRWRCRPEELGIKSIDAVEPLKEVIGQDRAVRALHLGLEMSHYGYNVFVTGASGTGRATTMKRLLQEYASRKIQLTDKCYVYNFRDPDSPHAMILAAGEAARFKKDLNALLQELLKALPAAFESRRYQEERKSMLEHFQSRQRSALKDLERRVKEKGFEVVQVQSGPGVRPEIAPVIDGNPVNMDQLQSKVDAGEMSEEQLKTLIAQQSELERLMDLVMREMRNIERKAKQSTETLHKKIVVPIVEELFDDIESRYDAPSVKEFLGALKNIVLEDPKRFYGKEEQPSMLGIPLQKEEDEFEEFDVNVIVDNGHASGVPIIIETNPHYKNLFGTIERNVDKHGTWQMDFMHIKAGSLLKADGGFLVINAIDALLEPGVWTTLKRTLRNRQLEIQPLETGLFGANSALKPEPIGLNVKVIMLGDARTYGLLYEMDDEFKKIFKIRADFDVEMGKSDKTIGSYVSFIKGLCTEEKLLPFGLTGVSEVVEYGARLAGNQQKLSTRFAVIADIVREANYWAGKRNALSVESEDVRKAISERIERVKLLEEKIQEMIEKDSILIDTDGAVIGQVNGLSVYESGGYAFGKPTRITVKTGMGRAGIINIEREAEMSGPSHNKGVLILSGYFRDMYAHNKPLILSASIAFEQSYSGVDGDSASSTEIYGLLSSLSGIPLRQDLAVTGSVNQHGGIQPIGGVNLKIEGFFDVCNARGLTGKQGVLIPKQNVDDLMLRHDVVEAVKKKRFHIYSISTIDEGIQLLTGKTAGKRKQGGNFAPGSIHALVDETLSEYATRLKKFGS